VSGANRGNDEAPYGELIFQIMRDLVCCGGDYDSIKVHEFFLTLFAVTFNNHNLFKVCTVQVLPGQLHKFFVPLHCHKYANQLNQFG